MSKITDKQKIDYLFKKKQNLGFTDLDTNNNFQPLFENRNYILGRDILSQDLPSVSDLTSDILITNSKVKLISDNFYNSSLSSLKSDRSGILIKVEKLKLIKVPNTSNSWYCLDSDGNNFLTPVISSNYGVKDGTKMADYQLEVYSKKGLDRFSRGESYLANELLRTCDYIFDYNTGILLLTDNCKDNEGSLINNSNPPYMTFFKYIGTTGAGSGSGSGTGSGGQWTKNVDDDIYFENGSVLIGTTTKSASLGQIDLEVDGNVYISGNLEVSGNVIKRDELHVYGDISANAAEFDEVDICGNLNVAGLLNGPGETTFVEYKNYNNNITFDQTDWYCIAKTEDTNTHGGRDNARGLFILDDYTSGERQQIIFYAGVTHSRGSYINVIANNWYDTNPPITKMKIMVSNNASLGADLFIYREGGTTSNKSLSVRVYQNRKKQNNPIEGGYWKLDSSPHTSPSLDVSGVVLDIDYNPNQKKANAVSSLAHYFQDSLKIASDLNVEGKSIFQNVSGADASFNNVDINDDLNVEGKSIFKNVSGADASFNNVDINDNLNVEGKSIFQDVSLNKIGTATTDVSNIIIDGNLVPFNNEGYDLGSSTNSWRDLYLSNNSIIFKQEGSNNEDDIVSIGIDTTDDGDGTTYTLQLNIKGKDDSDNEPAKKIKLARGKVRQTTNNGVKTRKAETFLEDASFNNIQGTIVSDEQNSITTMTGLTNVGTSGSKTVFASDISGADASFNKIDGIIVTAEQNSITMMTGLTNIGTSGNNTVFASDISGADASFNNIQGTIVTAEQNSITTMTSLTNVGTSGSKTVFASDISGADASFNKIDGIIVTAEQNSITTMSSLTNVGTSGSKTVFASDISGADASFNKIDGIIVTAEQNSITTMSGLVSIGTNDETTTFVSDISGADASFNKILGTVATDEQNSITTMTGLTNVGTSGNSTVFASDISGADASFNNLNVIGNKLNAKNIYLTGNIYQNGSLFSSTSSVNKIGQSFFDIITQQPSKFKFTGTNQTTTDVRIEWSYEDIIANQTDTILAKLSFQSAANLQNLPHINQIQIDISGNVENGDASNNQWLNYRTISVTDNYLNNNNSYTIDKVTGTAGTNVEKILRKTDFFDARVYGINHAEDYPVVNDRALIFRGLQFSQATPPSQPIRLSVESINANSFTVNYRVDQTESGVTGSSARINEILGKYTELTGNDTLVSKIVIQNTNEQTKTTSLNLLNAEDNLQIIFNNLRFGTKYDYKVSVKNNLSSTSSAYSNISTMSSFTELPSPGSKDINLDIHDHSLKNILKPSNSTALSDIIYINISESTGLKFANTAVQTFEVTDTSATTSSASGVGKGVDDENDIVEIEISKNENGGSYSSLQLIKYSGFDITNTNNNIKNIIHVIGASSAFITNVTTNDKYSSDTDTLRKGFRIEGKFQLNNIPTNNITSLIGGASSNPYGFKVDYTRTYGSVSGIGYTKEVYIDNLGSDPSITKTSGETFNITDQLYTMGIPSVKEFSATFNRTYNNICSQYGFIPGDGKIGEITSIAGTNKSSAIGVNITNSDIPTSSPFEKTKSTTISNVFYNTGTLLSSNHSLDVKEKAFSLFQPSGLPSDGGSDTITTNHFCDRNSYNLSSSQITSRKFNTTFYEITDTTELGKLNTNIGSIGVTEYSDTTHKTQIQPWTLLFIDGKLQTNNSQAYPDFSNSNFNQTGISSADQTTYSSGTSSYNLTGTLTNDDSGYKWIVFKIPSNSSTYIKEATSKTGGAGLPYIDVPAFIDSLPFNSSSDIKTKINTGFGSQNVIGFIRIINSNDAICIGRFTSNKVANNLWYLGGNSSSVSISTILANNGTGQVYGTLIDTGNYNVANGWGVECPTQSNFKSGSDIEIFIGLKNNVAL